jgi:DNA-binding response OmpR family regulator
MAAALDGIRVLLVDDNEDIREMVSMALRKDGADTLCAGSAKDALKAFDDFRPHVLISDLDMPEVDGYMLIQRLRERAAWQVPALVLSAYATPDDRVRSKEAGFQGHLGKPLDPDLLREAVRTLARRDPGGG